MRFRLRILSPGSAEITAWFHPLYVIFYDTKIKFEWEIEYGFNVSDAEIGSLFVAWSACKLCVYVCTYDVKS